MLQRKTKYLIVVLAEDLDVDTLPNELKTYLKTYTYIDARNYEEDLESIRKKIRFAMPGTPLGKIREMQRDAAEQNRDDMVENLNMNERRATEHEDDIEDNTDEWRDINEQDHREYRNHNQIVTYDDENDTEDSDSSDLENEGNKNEQNAAKLQEGEVAEDMGQSNDEGKDAIAIQDYKERIEKQCVAEVEDEMHESSDEELDGMEDFPGAVSDCNDTTQLIV